MGELRLRECKTKHGEPTTTAKSSGAPPSSSSMPKHMAAQLANQQPPQLPLCSMQQFRQQVANRTAEIMAAHLLQEMQDQK